MQNVVEQTPGQRFATEYGSKAVEEMLKTIGLTKRLALGIVVAVMAVSFQHQRHYLLHIGMDQFGAAIIPLVIDALTLLCVKVLSTTGMHRTAKSIALMFLVLPIAASGYINFVGSPNVAVGVVYLIAVACIAVAETIKAFIKPDFVSILAEEDRVQPAKQVGRTAGKKCAEGCTCGKHNRKPKPRKRTPRAPKAAPVSPGRVPVDELNADMAKA
ncbi:MAG TPA: DUF2637 domain-containing protein [Micromonosporaceae bacterium]